MCRLIAVLVRGIAPAHVQIDSVRSQHGLTLALVGYGSQGGVSAGDGGYWRRSRLALAGG
jgi:hypothetical protein